jgi:hypothetical protein
MIIHKCMFLNISTCHVLNISSYGTLAPNDTL